MYFKRYKEQAYDYELLIVKHEDLEKEKKHYEEKLQSAACEIENMKEMRAKSVDQEASLDKLAKEIDELEKREQVNLLELQRLRSCEAELNSALEKNKLKEDKILELLKQNSELDALRLDSNDQIKKIRGDYEEKLEQLTVENAILHSEKSTFQAQLVALREESLNESKNAIEEVSSWAHYPHF